MLYKNLELRHRGKNREEKAFMGIRLDRSLIKKIKQEAINADSTITELITAILQSWLEANKSTQNATQND